MREKTRHEEDHPMHSLKRDPKTNWTRAVATGGLALATLAFTGAAEAHERGSRHGVDRHGHRHAHHAHDRDAVRNARRYDRKLERRGDAIDFQLDLLAMIAAANGEYALAEHLDRKGDRIERRLDRRGDRALRDARGHVRHDHARDRKWSRKKERKLRRRLERERTRAWEHERRLERELARERDRQLAYERDRKRDREIARERDRRRDRDRDDRRDRTRRERRADRHLSHVDALRLNALDRLH